ncbi:type II toxin-antitoxin system PrlF family antitoxin [Methylobacterium sp. J-092]|uniref:type II toxin-antitoxin system PrlF family antitoxin n=1 Tax=Methylobacterium sp. J-092 TaxID=2836667 RepID=UPI001FBA1299|nr:type II toxin-antitoxin system PrlF family antitoxin [Methylobacterium sp. J-092]MCJ2010334.1 type II toxin-antitoxin system PrlF family antitoxin [Methylobacterium sp. J-092]
MGPLVRERSKITAKGQTTVPKAMRQALGVSYGGEIAYVVDEGGVRLTRVEVEEADPVIEGFLAFLAQDMARRPQAITPFPADLMERMSALAEGIDADPGADIDGPVAL